MTDPKEELERFKREGPIGGAHASAALRRCKARTQAAESALAEVRKVWNRRSGLLSHAEYDQLNALLTEQANETGKEGDADGPRPDDQLRSESPHVTGGAVHRDTGGPAESEQAKEESRCPTCNWTASEYGSGCWCPDPWHGQAKEEGK